MNAPVGKKREALPVAAVAVLAFALAGGSAFGAVGDIRHAARAPVKLVTEVPVPLPHSDRLADLSAPAVVMAMLPGPTSPAPAGVTDVVLDEALLTTAVGHETVDYDAVFDEPGAEAFYAVVVSAVRPADLLRAQQTAAPRRVAARPLRPFLALDRLPVLLNVVSADVAAPIVTVPIPTYPQAAPVDFTALLNADGNVILGPSDDEERKDVRVPPGRFAMDRLELGRTPTRLEMDECQFAVTGGVRLMHNGRIITHVGGAPAGLDLSDDAFLEISRGAKIILLWHGAPTVEGIHWGMRAKGDRREEFRELLRTGRIIIGKLENGAMAISKAVIIFDGEYTYITIDFPVYDKPINSRAFEIRVEPQEIPEPASILLLSLGACLPILRRRRLTARSS